MSYTRFTTRREEQPASSLPDEAGAPANLKTVVLHFTAAIGLVVIFNFVAYLFLGFYTSNYGYWVVKNKWRLLTSLETPVDWLILGDSSANQAVNPEVIEEQAGKSSLNLGTIGNMTAVDDLWMLEEYLKRFGAPEKVVIVHVYDMWHRDFEYYLAAHIPLGWGFWEEYRLSDELIPPAVRRDIFIERFLPLYSQTRTLRDILFRGVTSLDNPLNPGYDLTEEGFFPAYEAKPELVRASLDENIRFVDETVFEMSPANEAAIREIAGLADEWGFDVYLVTSPVFDELYQYPGFQRYLGDVYNRLETFDARSANVYLVKEIQPFPPEQLQNPDHLIVSGAEIYTRWLIERLRTTND